MTYRTEQDKINRKEANRRYYKLEENKQQKRDYMKEYQKRAYVKARAHEKYLKRKIRIAGDEIFGQKEKEELERSYRQSLANKKEREQKANEELNMVNSERFINYDEETRK